MNGTMRLITMFVVATLLFTAGAISVSFFNQPEQKEDCFTKGYDAQIIKDNKPYCCNINHEFRFINCKKISQG